MYIHLSVGVQLHGHMPHTHTCRAYACFVDSLNIISHNSLIWFISSYQNTHEKRVNVVNKRARDVEPSFSFSICQGQGVFQRRARERRRERQKKRGRGLEGEGVSFSILCSPENPIMKRQSTKSSEPLTETEGPFFNPKGKGHGWGNSATQHATTGTTPLLEKRETKGTVLLLIQ